MSRVDEKLQELVEAVNEVSPHLTPKQRHVLVKNLLHNALLTSESRHNLCPQADQLKAVGLYEACTKIADQNLVTLGDVFGSSRVTSVVRARDRMMLLMRRERKMTYASIGNFFGKDHTTVMEAIKRALHEQENEE